jgi:predicted GNAT family acetyltransferase
MSPVRDNRNENQFELEQDGQVAILAYDRDDKQITLIHTEVPPPLRGQGVGEALVRGALEQIRGDGLRIVAVCPFVRAYMKKHPAA